MLNLEEIRASEVDGHYGGFGLGGEHACYCNEIAYLMSRVESLENLVGVLAERRAVAAMGVCSCWPHVRPLSSDTPPEDR